MKKDTYLLLNFLYLIFLVLTIVSCNKKLPATYNPAFNNYITAFPKQVITRDGSIKIRLVEPAVATKDINKPIKKELFYFEPEIEGTTRWIDNRTIEFKPNKPLPHNTNFSASLNLGKLINDVPDSLQLFPFNFQTMGQQFTIHINGLDPIDPDEVKWQRLKGHISTTDYEAPEVIKEITRATINNNPCRIKWTAHEKTKHTFIIDSLERTVDRQTITIHIDGKKAGLETSAQEIVSLPALGSFRFTTSRVHNDKEQYITLEFSDPIDNNQLLNGLVYLENGDNKLQVDGNKILVYPEKRLNGTVKVVMEPGIFNVVGHKTQDQVHTSVVFETPPPQVELVDNKTILPGTDHLPFVFQAINLNAVDIQVMRIREKNIPQFLQVNDLEDDWQIQRVGEVIMTKKINLDKDPELDLRKWNRHAIDLKDLVKNEPGAIYRVSVGFRRSYSIFPCDEGYKSDFDPSTLSIEYGEKLTKDNFWKYNGSTQPYEDWDWDKDEDPCHSTFYRISYGENRTAEKNILFSKLGVIAKSESGNRYLFAVTDLHSTNPIPKVKMEVYNYQNRKLSTVYTNGSGIARSDISDEAYLVVASYGNQKGYLKLGDGHALSLSKFDVSGTSNYAGIQGFLYTERGVWRPGDSIFVNLIIADKEKKLPADHPIGFEFINPKGKTIQRDVTQNGLNGIYSFPCKTNPGDITGNYTVKAYAGGRTFQKNIKVETIRPNRLKVKLDFNQEVIHKNDMLNGKLNVHWLHGAPARNMHTEVTVMLKQDYTGFSQYPEYTFQSSLHGFKKEWIKLYDETIDEEGKGSFTKQLYTENTAPGKLIAHFRSRVYEPGGNFSTDFFQLPYHPFETYLGMHWPESDGWYYYTDTTHTVELITVTPEGKPAKDNKVIAEVYKLSSRWWWDVSSGDYSYHRKTEEEVVMRDTISLKNSKGKWDINLARANRGTYLVRFTLPNGHRIERTVRFYPRYYNYTADNEQEGTKLLSLTADKEAYTTGEKVTLSIPTAAKGKAFVSLENGYKIIKTDWVNIKEGNTAYTFIANTDMAPYIYAHVMYMQPHAQTDNDLPIRMYGVLPIKIENPASRLKPVIQMDEELQPNKKTNIRISESSGKAMTYTIAMVDEGLLDLTHFPTPDPWTAFHQKPSLEVKTWDVFDQVIDAGSIQAKNLLSIGGDGSGAPAEGTKANRFKPMVKFMGPFYLPAGSKKTHTIRMPNYIGSVKTMVVAAHDGAYGNTEKVTPVRKPLMVLGTLPRVLGPNELVKFPVTVFCMDESITDVSVSVEVNELLEVTGESSKLVHFNKPGDQLAYFFLKVKPELGIGHVKVQVKSGTETAFYDVELDVRNPNPRVTDLFATNLATGKSWKHDLQPVGMKGTNELTIEVSSIPPINLSKRLDYLISYPFGCVEQTTSSAFPQLYLSRFVDLDQDQKKQTDANIRLAIVRLMRFQTSDGALSYWPGDYHHSEWGTNYAGHFLLEAKQAGYTVPPGFLNKWINYQRKRAREWNYREDNEMAQGYRLYLLALAGKPELGAMNRMRHHLFTSEITMWYLASAYQLSGQPEIARDLISHASLEVRHYRELSGTFGSDTRDRAIILQTLTLLGEDRKAAEMAKKLASELSEDRWMSTQTTAYSLVALAHFIGNEKMSKELAFSWNTGDTWNAVVTDKPFWKKTITLNELHTYTTAIQNRSEGVIFVRLLSTGIPIQGDTTDVANGIKMWVTYKTIDGKLLDPKSLTQGTDFVAEVVLSNNTLTDYDELSLTQIFPSGWEIHNTRMDAAVTSWKNIADYEDIRDDRVNIFYDLPRYKNRTFKVFLNASYLGKYYLPTIYTEAMYDHSINARKHGYWVEVTKRKAQ